MTNKEWLQILDMDKLADFLTMLEPPCDYCKNKNECTIGDMLECHGNHTAWRNWLLQEV